VRQAGRLRTLLSGTKTFKGAGHPKEAAAENRVSILASELKKLARRDWCAKKGEPKNSKGKRPRQVSQLGRGVPNPKRKKRCSGKTKDSMEDENPEGCLPKRRETRRKQRAFIRRNFCNHWKRPGEKPGPTLGELETPEKNLQLGGKCA